MGLWTPSLADSSSAAFIEMSRKLQDDIESLYADIPGDQAVNVLKFV